MKSHQTHSAEKLTAKELYLISLQHKTATSSSQKYFESMFRDLTLRWKQIYALTRIITIDSKLGCFQYKILNNTLCLNQKIFCFTNNNSLCLFCNLEDETVIHLFVHFSKTKRLEIFIFLYYHHRVPFLASNNFLLLFKYYVCISRNSKVLSFEALFKSTLKVSSQSDERKKNCLQYNRKQFCKTCKTLRKYEVPFL